MKFMLTFTLKQHSRDEAIRRFKGGLGQPPKGVALLGRWTAVDLTVGFVLLESDDVGALTDFALRWSDVIELRLVPVIDDAPLVEVLGRGGH
jgi:hypothetical protein